MVSRVEQISYNFGNHRLTLNEQNLAACDPTETPNEFDKRPFFNKHLYFREESVTSLKERLPFKTTIIANLNDYFKIKQINKTKKSAPELDKIGLFRAINPIPNQNFLCKMANIPKELFKDKMDKLVINDPSNKTLDEINKNGCIKHLYNGLINQMLAMNLERLVFEQILKEKGFKSNDYILAVRMRNLNLPLEKVKMVIRNRYAGKYGFDSIKRTHRYREFSIVSLGGNKAMFDEMRDCEEEVNVFDLIYKFVLFPSKEFAEKEANLKKGVVESSKYPSPVLKNYLKKVKDEQNKMLNNVGEYLYTQKKDLIEHSESIINFYTIKMLMRKLTKKCENLYLGEVIKKISDNTFLVRIIKKAHNKQDLSLFDLLESNVFTTIPSTTLEMGDLVSFEIHVDDNTTEINAIAPKLTSHSEFHYYARKNDLAIKSLDLSSCEDESTLSLCRQNLNEIRLLRLTKKIPSLKNYLRRVPEIKTMSRSQLLVLCKNYLARFALK